MENKLIFKNKELKICDSRVLGICGENEQEKLVFEMSEGFKDGICFLEIEFPDGTTEFVETTKNASNYSLIVKNNLLKQAGILKMQLKIIQNDIQVWKSQTFEMKVKNAINATETIKDDYPDFVETTALKLQELEEKINEIEIPSTGEGSEEIIISEEEPTTEEWKIWIDEDEDVPQYITNEVDDLKNYYSKTDIDEKIINIEPPSIEGLATEEYVNEQINAIEIPSVEGLASEQYVQDEIAKIEAPSEIIISNEEPTEEWKVWIDEDEASIEYVTIEQFNETLGNIESLLAEV